MNILLIDTSVPDYQVFVDSVNSHTKAILYTKTIPELSTVLFETVDRIGIVFVGKPPEITIQVKHIDFLGCNTLPRWQSYYDELTKKGIIVGASNNRTGNLRYGGDWTMESTGEDIERIYFTKSIEYYKYLLDIGYHSMVLLNDGSIWAAGDNAYGQLSTDVIQSEFFINTGHKGTAISTGRFHSLSIFNGTVWSTGLNNYGQLGLGSTNSAQEFTYTELSNAEAISAGFNHSMVLLKDGTVWAAGNNSFGQLGISVNQDFLYFSNTSVSNVKAIASGGNHSMILLNDGTVWTTGLNNFGQLGLNTLSNVYQFTQTNITDAVAIAAGYSHSLVLLKDGTVWTTGLNNSGQLGLDTNINVSQFTQTNVTNAVAITAGTNHSLVLLNDGTVYSTGLNFSGQLGLNTNINVSQFTNTNFSNVISFSAGDEYSMVLLNDGTVWSTGMNSAGELGIGNFGSPSQFTQTDLPNGASLLTTVPISYLIPIVSEGTLVTIGNNMNYSPITNETISMTRTFYTSFTQLLTSIVKAGFTRYGITYLKEGTTNTFGRNQYGELVDNFACSDFSTGLDHSLFIQDGQAYSSGSNTYGQLGQGKESIEEPLTLIDEILNVTMVKTGHDFSAFLSEGAVFMCGNNTYGQLGQGDFISRSTVSLAPTPTATAVACGSYHTLFLCYNTVYSCGQNTFGQLGQGTVPTSTTVPEPGPSPVPGPVPSPAPAPTSPTIDPSFPTLITRLTNIVSISAGGNNSAAIDKVGNLWLWGQDYTDIPTIVASQVSYVDVTLCGIFYVSNNQYYLRNGQMNLFGQSSGILQLTGASLPFSIRSNICFLGDTPVTTDQGDIPISTINPNLHTIRGKKIVAITETYSTEKYLIVFEPDALFTGCPIKRTVMSKEHKIFFQGKMREAATFVNNRNIHCIPYQEEKLYNVVLEEHGRMKVNNMIVETLDPNNVIGKVFKAIHDSKT